MKIDNSSHSFLISTILLMSCCFPTVLLATDRLPVEIKKQLLLKQYDSAIPELIKLVANNHNEARYQLALYYLKEEDSNSSLNQAIQLLQDASDNGYTKASYLLGTLYFQGNRIDKDIATANSYLSIAAQKGHRLAKTLVQQINHNNNTNTVSQKESEQQLYYAARIGDKLLAQEALASGANINHKNTHGNTPLIIASRNKQYAFLKWFISNRPDATIKNNNKDTALHFIGLAGQTSIAKSLILIDAPLNIKNTKGRTPLINAVHSGKAELVNLLLLKGANSNLQDKQQKTALDYALNKGSPELISVLRPYTTDSYAHEKQQQTLVQLSKQTQLKGNLYYGWPILAVAVAQNESKLIVELINTGVNPWLQSDTGISALSIAASKDTQQHTVELLKNTETLTNKQQQQAIELLVMAAKKDNVDFIQNIIKKLSPSILTKISFMDTPLWHAIEKSSEESAIVLVNWQQLDSRIDTKGENLLHLAVKQNLLKLVESLINKGYNTNTTDLSGRSTFWYAADQGNSEIMTLLFKHNANILKADLKGNTPLHRTVLSGNKQAVSQVIQYGSEINKQSINGNSAIFLAASSKPDILKILINRGADVTLRNHLSYTPLMIAVKNKCLLCIQHLIAADANPSRKNSKGINSFDLAKDDKQLIALLDQY